MVNRERGVGVAASAHKSADLLKRARERTELELAKRTVDLTAGGSRGTMIAALAVAAALPLADAANLLDGLIDVAGVPLLESEDRSQQAPCKRRCG